MPVYIKFEGVEGESRDASTPKLQEACADGTVMPGEDGFDFAPAPAPMETRESLEAAGLEVVVAAATTETATPHAISVVGGREPAGDGPPADELTLNFIEIEFI